MSNKTNDTYLAKPIVVDGNLIWSEPGLKGGVVTYSRPITKEEYQTMKKEGTN
ncbi:MAG: hypothetical protein LUE31_01965 [Lachnospiraceae bacterium]|nr:hypothetical protein [Lachnospiraceae bacterium]